MATILHLETSEKVCSVGISDQDRLIAVAESKEERSHAKRLTLLIEEVLEKSKPDKNKPGAIAVSIGPGSYTGLRIGVSTAKAMAYAWNIPIVAVDTLEIIAFAALKVASELTAEKDEEILICPAMDARRMEVYYALFNKDLHPFKESGPLIIEPSSFKDLLHERRVIFCGSGAAKISQSIDHPNALYLKELLPHARYMPSLAWELFREGKFEDIAYFEPFYLKDFQATKPRKFLGS